MSSTYDSINFSVLLKRGKYEWKLLGKWSRRIVEYVDSFNVMFTCTNEQKMDYLHDTTYNTTKLFIIELWAVDDKCILSSTASSKLLSVVASFCSNAAPTTNSLIWDQLLSISKLGYNAWSMTVLNASSFPRYFSVSLVAWPLSNTNPPSNPSFQVIMTNMFLGQIW